MKQRALSVVLAATLSVMLIQGAMPTAASAKTYRAGAYYTREFQLADQTLQTGRYDSAEATYMSILKKNPNSLPARSGLSLAQAELYKLDASEKNAKQVLAKDSGNAMAYAALGAAYRNRTASLDMTYKSRRDDLLQQSAQNLEKARSINPNSPEILNQLGETYRMQGRYNEAQEVFEKALHSDPAFAEALVNYGVTRMAQGDVDGAKSAYNRAIRMNSKNYNAHYRLGEAYLQEGDSHKALQSLNTALSLSPGNASVLSKTAEANLAQGNTSAAVANFQKAILTNPAFMPAYIGISNLYDSRGDGELAMAQLKSALNVNPNFNPARDRLGYLALQVDKPDQALQYYREALNVDPHDPAALEGMSQALMVVAQRTASQSEWSGQESNLADSETAVEEALRYNPDNLQLHLAHLRLSQLAGKPQASEAELQTILNTPAKTDVDKMIQGQAHFALGQYPQSDTIYRDLIQRAQGDPNRLILIGDTLKAEGDLQMAREAYRAVPAGNIKAQRALQRIANVESDSKKDLRLANALNRKGISGIFNRNQKQSSIDYYEDSLSKNPRQPEARLELSRLYERFKEYDKAALSYQMYLGLMPQLPSDKRQGYEEKITKLRSMATTYPQTTP